LIVTMSTPKVVSYKRGGPKPGGAELERKIAGVLPVRRR
jgi:hypothetical protein